MAGERYTNGIMEGMLSGRANYALEASLNTKGEKREAYLKAAQYAQAALFAYEVNGDSDEVRQLTTLSFDWMDKANEI